MDNFGQFACRFLFLAAWFGRSFCVLLFRCKALLPISQHFKIRDPENLALTVKEDNSSAGNAQIICECRGELIAVQHGNVRVFRLSSVETHLRRHEHQLHLIVLAHVLARLRKLLPRDSRVFFLRKSADEQHVSLGAGIHFFLGDAFGFFPKLFQVDVSQRFYLSLFSFDGGVVVCRQAGLRGSPQNKQRKNESNNVMSGHRYLCSDVFIAPVRLCLLYSPTGTPHE